MSMLQDSGDLAQLFLALETVAHVSKVPRKKSDFFARPGTMDLVTSQLKNMTKSANSENRLRSLAILADLVSGGDNEMEVNRRILDSFDPSPIEYLQGFAKQPFPDISTAGHRVLKVLSSQSWALERFHGKPGFMEFLMDRSVNSCKEVIETKYEILESISSAETATRIFTPQIMDRVNKYVKEGPYHSVSKLEVAFDEA